MGGVQSGTHNFGDALWVQERQKQKCFREGSRYESKEEGSSTQERKQLLKRTRSLAVISEDEWRNERDSHLRASETKFDLSRRPQLIPRAKLIDRNSLKDRLSKSQQHLIGPYERSNTEARTHQSKSVCELHSIPTALSTLPDPVFYVNRSRQQAHPDRLNILEWSHGVRDSPPRRYCSIQELDTVSGLVDIVEDNWPIEGNRSIDCIYTQVKRKRKEHRSLDSILFENDDELEYFDVLKLLPLSNIRLEVAEAESKYRRDERNSIKPIEPSPASSQYKDEYQQNYSKDQRSSNYLGYDKDKQQESGNPPDVIETTPVSKEVQEQAEDSQSIWISDSEEIEDMSRRPQVLKVIDNDVTRRQCRPPKVVEIDVVDDKWMNTKESADEITHIEEKENSQNEGSNITDARNFFESKTLDRECLRNRQNKGKFERIVKETSSILGKACSAVKGSFGFETRSDSSDPGLGSECDSDIRRHSVDDSAEVKILETSSQKKNHYYEDKKNGHMTLTRSRSCADSIDQDPGEPEFDHVRYKIVKSNLFGKNLYANFGNSDVTYDGLMQYLKEYSFQELLLDNNVVIIEPVRAESIDRKPTSMKSATTNGSGSKLSVESRSTERKVTRSSEKSGNKTCRQSSLRKHFFYQPIRVNRELIDDELPNPDTVRNVREMFEATFKNGGKTSDARTAKQSSKCTDKENETVENITKQIDEDNELKKDEEKGEEIRSRCSSRAKDLTKHFENLRGNISPKEPVLEKDNHRSESKTKMLAQCFEIQSRNTTSSLMKNQKPRFTQLGNPPFSNAANKKYSNQKPNWDSGSVSSGVSSDYPDTDPGSVCLCSSEDEIECQVARTEKIGHFVSPDVLKKIRECGTSVTYYGGKVVNAYNAPMISPVPSSKRFNKLDEDWFKFRLVKSNSCDSRLELTGRLVEDRFPLDVRHYEPVAEAPSLEICSLEETEKEIIKDENKREPPVVVGLEPKKDEAREFELGMYSGNSIMFSGNSPLRGWQINENHWTRNQDFGKMEFEEFQVLEDSLDDPNNRSEII